MFSHLYGFAFSQNNLHVYLRLFCSMTEGRHCVFSLTTISLSYPACSSHSALAMRHDIKRRTTDGETEMSQFQIHKIIIFWYPLPYRIKAGVLSIVGSQQKQTDTHQFTSGIKSQTSLDFGHTAPLVCHCCSIYIKTQCLSSWSNDKLRGQWISIKTADWNKWL